MISPNAGPASPKFKTQLDFTFSRPNFDDSIARCSASWDYGNVPWEKKMKCAEGGDVEFVLRQPGGKRVGGEASWGLAVRRVVVDS